jgi:hypothetical protein
VTNGDTTGDRPTPARHLHPVDPNEPPYDPAFDKEPGLDSYADRLGFLASTIGELDPSPLNGPITDNAAEMAVLGAILIDPSIAPSLAPELTPTDFWRPAHSDLWNLIQDLTARDETPDLVTLGPALHAAGITKKFPSGPAYLADLMRACPNPAQAPAYAQIVRDTARLRQLDNIALTLRQTARNATATDAGRHLEQAFDALEQVVTRWGPAAPSSNSGLVDLSWLAGGTPPTVEPPTILRRTDGHALFYAGKVNGIFGDPECGKTWIAQAAGLEALYNGGTFAIIDVDHNGPVATAGRLSLLGAHVGHLADPTRFRYYQPDDPDELRAAIDDVVRHAPTVVLIDSIGEAIPMLGANTNDGDEITNAMRFLCTRPADTGSCVITIDHLPKNTEARSTGYAIGSIAKKRMIRGAYIRAEARLQPAPGQKGLITLRIEKDTAGELRRHSGGGYAGTFTLDSRYPGDQLPDQPQGHGSVTWSLGRDEAPKNTDGTFRPTQLMEKISRFVEENDLCTGRDVAEGVKGKGEYVHKALKLLIHEGFITAMPGKGRSILHHSAALYREAEDDHA